MTLPPNNGDDMERWLDQLNVPMTKVYFFVRGDWIGENQVADESTFKEVVLDRMRSRNCNHTMWQAGTSTVWYVMRRDGTVRQYPTQDAAAMVVIHG